MSKIYFGKPTEIAIIKYNTLTDPLEKNRLFESSIYKPFKEIAKRVIQRWKVYYVEEGYEEELVLHMWDNLAGYQPELGRAFSYFTYMARNKAWKDNKLAYAKIKQDDEPGQADNIDETHQKFVLNDYDQEMELQDNFTDKFVNIMQSKINKLFPNRVENQCANAILDVIKRRDKLDMFDKKTLAVYVKEMTAVSDSKFVEVLKTFKRQFAIYYDIYLNDGQLEEEDQYISI